MTPPPNSGVVTWDIYVDDRRAHTEQIARVEGKIDRLERKLDRFLDRLGKVELAHAHEEGQGAAEEGHRRTRRELLRSVGLQVSSAVIGGLVALLIAYATGGL